MVRIYYPVYIQRLLELILTSTYVYVVVKLRGFFRLSRLTERHVPSIIIVRCSGSECSVAVRQIYCQEGLPRRVRD